MAQDEEKSSGEGLDAEAYNRRRRGRSLAIAFVLAGLAVLFYVVTVIKLGPGVMNRPL
ncbi:MAG: hypothetical protein H6880_00845 [Rhodobiaceae bacterium]|nr:hypothetical protein [Rhodobiaceae bacterium]